MMKQTSNKFDVLLVCLHSAAAPSSMPSRQLAGGLLRSVGDDPLTQAASAGENTFNSPEIRKPKNFTVCSIHSTSVMTANRSHLSK